MGQPDRVASAVRGSRDNGAAAPQRQRPVNIATHIAIFALCLFAGFALMSPSFLRNPLEMMRGAPRYRRYGTRFCEVLFNRRLLGRERDASLTLQAIELVPRVGRSAAVLHVRWASTGDWQTRFERAIAFAQRWQSVVETTVVMVRWSESGADEMKAGEWGVLLARDAQAWRGEDGWRSPALGWRLYNGRFDAFGGASDAASQWYAPRAQALHRASPSTPSP